MHLLTPGLNLPFSIKDQEETHVPLLCYVNCGVIVQKSLLFINIFVSAWHFNSDLQKEKTLIFCFFMRYKSGLRGLVSKKKIKKKAGGGFYLFPFETQLASTVGDAMVTEELVS